MEVIYPGEHFSIPPSSLLKSFSLLTPEFYNTKLNFIKENSTFKEDTRSFHSKNGKRRVRKN